MPSPADHAATIREDAAELEKAIRQHVPDGYDQVELDHDGPLRRECLERLAALVTQAEQAAQTEMWYERENRRSLAAEARADQLHRELLDVQRQWNAAAGVANDRIAQLQRERDEAYDNGFNRAAEMVTNKLEARAERAETALRHIADDPHQQFGWVASDLARAALAGDTP